MWLIEVGMVMFGVVAFVWPHALFAGSRVFPDEAKIRRIRLGGTGLAIAGAVFLVIRVIDGYVG
jgi:hypothetical protein